MPRADEKEPAQRPITEGQARLFQVLLVALTLVAAMAGWAFSRWADAVGAATQEVTEMVQDIAQQIRRDQERQRERFEQHLEYSRDKTNDYDARLGILEAEAHRHRGNGRIEHRKSPPVED